MGSEMFDKEFLTIIQPNLRTGTVKNAGSIYVPHVLPNVIKKVMPRARSSICVRSAIFRPNGSVSAI